jgi:hypothetical protein
MIACLRIVCLRSAWWSDVQGVGMGDESRWGAREREG